MAIARRNPSVLTAPDVYRYLVDCAEVDPEVSEWAEKQLAKPKSTRKPTPAEIEAANRQNTIYEYLLNHPKSTAEEIAVGLSTEESALTKAQVIGACVVLKKNGKVETPSERTVSHISNGKSVKSKVKEYVAIPTEDGEDGAEA